jgi:hypothetical protein
MTTIPPPVSDWCRAGHGRTATAGTAGAYSVRWYLYAGPTFVATAIVDGVALARCHTAGDVHAKMLEFALAAIADVEAGAAARAAKDRCDLDRCRTIIQEPTP